MLSLMKSKMIRGGFGLIAVVASVWLGAGCTNTEVVGGPSPLDTEDGFCQAFATAQCSAALVESCYGLAPMSAALDKDTTRCVAAASVQDVCNPTGLPYHKEAAQDALDTITGLYQDGILTKAELPALSAALATVFNHGGTQGSHCAADNDCDAGNGLTCILHGGEGSCGMAKTVSAGASCALVNAECNDTDYCAKISVGHFNCVAKVAPNQTNPKLSVCAGDYECVSGSRCENGHCRGLIQDGGQCSIGSECANSFCLKKSADDKTGTCFSQDKFDPFSSSCDIYR
jgi:hypothetical protein